MSTHRAVGRDELTRARWIKSSRSGTGGGNCVEVASLPDSARAVRDSKRSTGAVLIFSAEEWAVFTAGVRTGEFD